jgi:NAD(P)-dependent dehydrogenase (short-subunit alcohol dehydrogenase family)
VKREQGRLDILVNNAIAIPAELTQPGSFWEKPISNWEMIDVGVRSNFVAAWHAAQTMVPQRSGLIVALSGYVGVTYTMSVVFGTCKTATDRMARDMAIELKPHNVASLSLWQGFTYTERAKENLKNVPSMASQLNSPAGSSVDFPGRIIAALARDSELMQRSGGTFIAAELAQEYRITDVDGRVIPSLRAQRGAPIWSPI